MADLTALTAEERVAYWRDLANRSGALVEAHLPAMRKLEAENAAFRSVIEDAIDAIDWARSGGLVAKLRTVLIEHPIDPEEQP